MAKQLDKTDTGEQDLEILNPNVDITIAGRQLTVREYGFVEGLRLRALYKPFIDSLRALTAKPEVTPIEQILDIIAEHHETVIDLVAQAAGIDHEWIEALDDDNGTALLFVWWRVNGPFFVRQLQNRWVSELFQPLPLNPISSAGATSTPR